jgi:hypothetical protein
MKKDIFALTMAVIAGGMVVSPAYAGNNASSPVSTFASAEEYCTKEASNLMFTLPPLGRHTASLRAGFMIFAWLAFLRQVMRTPYTSNRNTSPSNRH